MRLALLWAGLFLGVPAAASSPEALSAAAFQGFLRSESLVERARLLIEPGNFAELPEGGLFRGAKLSSPENYYYLKRELKVDVVINFREEADDARACRLAALRCLHFPIKLFWPITTNIDWDVLRAAYAKLLEERAAGRRVYFHCTHGSDRTGAMGAALAVRREACGKPGFDRGALWARVEAELRRHRLHETWFPNLKKDIKSLVYEFEKSEAWLCR